MKNTPFFRTAAIQRHLRQAFLLGGILFGLQLLPSCKKRDQPAPVAKPAPTPVPPIKPVDTQRTFGRISYTIYSPVYGSTSGKEDLTRESLVDLSRNQMTISVENQFNIKLFSAQAFKKDATYCLEKTTCSSKEFYSTGSTWMTDFSTGIRAFKPFTEGHTRIVEFKPAEKKVQVYFQYSYSNPLMPDEDVHISGNADLTYIR